ncbi:MAG: 4'-phosphopantetheinyl transferase superfamily protein [Luteitalea sp.]|nr:4'-phosphopantetheinyl transferase superfamily protein [Luteitalea sp.]
MTNIETMAQFLTKQLPAGSLGGVRPIRAGDELLLRPTELEGLERAVVSVRRASGAGRNLARELCGRMGAAVAEIPRSSGRGPVWPAGIVGSIGHDRLFAAAVVASTQAFGGVGIDVESPAGLSDQVVELIGSAEEIADFRQMPCGDKVLFSLKEAVFKAVHPRDRVFLEFHDVTVDRRSRTATTRYGRAVQWRALVEPRILTVAWW